MKDRWKVALRHLDEGNFTSLQNDLGGADAFDRQIIEWVEDGRFADEPEALAEAFTCACMLGRVKVAERLLDHGVDPYSGMKTGLSGFHYAASSGRLEAVKLLIERRLPIEIKNMYGGTVFGQAMWSAIHEWTPDHAEIVERLIDAGAIVEDGYSEWWEEQAVPSAETKTRISDALRRRLV